MSRTEACGPGPSLQAKCLQVVGVTGFEPVTLRLSSACSNQLSYTPAFALRARAGRPAKNGPSPGWPASRGPLRRAKAGGAEEIRTPDL